MEEKKCPVDRGKLLLALKCCQGGDSEICQKCPYSSPDCDVHLSGDALAYINYLEDQLGVTG